MNKNIKSTQQLARMHGAKCMVYGGAGAGKTRLAASAPRPLVISAEKGLLSLRNFNIPAWEIENLKRLGEVYEFLHKSNDARQFDTIILDSASDIAEVIFADIQSKQRDPRKLYPELEMKVTTAFRDFRDISGKNVVFLAKMKSVSDALGNKSYQPTFPGNKLSEAAPYFFDEVFYLYREVFPDQATGQQIEYRIFRTQPNSQYAAKDRSGSLAELENADPATGGGLGYIFKKMLS